MKAKKGKTLLGLVSFYTEKNRIREGLRINKTSFVINQKNNDVYSLADNYYMFGRLFHQQGDHKLAVANYLKAIDLAEKSRNLWVISVARRSLAFLYLDEGNEGKSYENIYKAIKVAQDADSKEALGFCYGVLGEIDRNFGKAKQAAAHFEKANQYFQTTQNEYGQAWLYTNWSLLDLSKVDKS